MSNLTSVTVYLGQVSAIVEFLDTYAYYSKPNVEFLDTYGSIVFHYKKIHCKTLMTIFCQFFLDILFHYKTFTHTFFNCKKKSLAKYWWLYFINFSMTFYSITRHLHIHYLIEKKNPLQNIDDYLFQFFLVILFPYKTFTHTLFNCKKNPLQKIDDYLFPCNFIPLQSIYTNII